MDYLFVLLYLVGALGVSVGWLRTQPYLIREDKYTVVDALVRGFLWPVYIPMLALYLLVRALGR